MGKEVATLVDERQTAGYKHAEFNTAQYGSLASGVYIYKLTSGALVKVRSMVLVK
jgi:hypothetical protein